MISMLIYSCKQSEIELLKEISRDIMAYQSDERLDVVIFNKPGDITMDALESIDVAYIDVTNQQGLQVAKELRSKFPNVEIMIISDNTISPMLYLTPHVRAASLLLKPLSHDMIEKGIQELFNVLKPDTLDKGDVFVFEDEKEKRRLPYAQILYFEARNRRVYIRVQNKEYGIYGSLEALEEVLPEQFKRCHRSFIVNTSYIGKVWYSKNSILLKNDEEVPLSRSYKTVIKEAVNNES